MLNAQCGLAVRCNNHAALLAPIFNTGIEGMIHIEDVTEAEQEKYQAAHAKIERAAGDAEASEQQTTPAVESPETDANGGQDGQEISDSTQQDIVVSAPLCFCKHI